MKNGFVFSGLIYSILIIFLSLIFSIISTMYFRKLIIDKLKYDVIKRIDEDVIIDNSGANPPVLYDNMIPVRYNGENWVYVDTSKQWYSYDEQEWANAVILNDNISKKIGDVILENEVKLWYVWIPRYKYQLFNFDNSSTLNQMINIKFENGVSTTGSVSCHENRGSGSLHAESESCSNNDGIIKNGDWYTHPAFTFGDKNALGFWISKFELSGDFNNLKSIPNTNQNRVQSLVSGNISMFNNSIKKINIVNNNFDGHMIKNIEWGAVAYLSQSNYGNNGIEVSSNLTSYPGGNNYLDNYNQSTSNNIYGVYDMSGGVSEYVMGTIFDKHGAFVEGDSGIYSLPEYKYIDIYVHGHSNEGKLGDATYETKGWFNDDFDFPTGLVKNAWMSRGGDYNSNSGMFSINKSKGESNQFVGSRIAIICTN